MDKEKIVFAFSALAVLAVIFALWIFVKPESSLPASGQKEIPGTILHLKFDGADPIVGNTPAFMGSAQFSDNGGISGGSVKFLGTEGMVNAGQYPTNFKDKVSVMFWVKYKSYKQSYAVFKYDSFLIQLYQNNNSTWQVTGGIYYDDSVLRIRDGYAHQHMNMVSSGNSVPIELNKWYHIAFIYDATQLSTPNAIMYVNGQVTQVLSNFREPIITDLLQPIKIGGRGETGWDRNMNGEIDDVVIVDGAITSAQVLQHYNAGKSAVSVSITSANSGQ